MDFTLRPWQPEDAESIAALADNKKIADNLRDGFPNPYTLEDARLYIASCILTDDSKTIVYAVEHGGSAVGSIGVFKKDDVYRKSAELGYWLGERYWGKGIMTRAVYLMSRIAFSRLDIVRISAEPFAGNKASRRVLEKAGFELEGVLQKSICKNGVLGDSCVYALIRNDKDDLSRLSLKELWQLFPIILSDYSGAWPIFYALEKEVLVYFIGKDLIFRINHIGSTAVPGLLAKPTIDILLEIKWDTDLEELKKAMRRAGYIYSPQPKNPWPHMMFMRGYTVHGFSGQVFHVHVRYPGDWDELYFRDYLRVHPEVSAMYGVHKKDLAEDFKNDRDGYTEAKTDFIEFTVRSAREEFGPKYDIQLDDTN